MSNKKRSAPIGDENQTKRRKNVREPQIFHNLVQPIKVLTTKGWVKAKALFDTGSPVFIIQSYWAKHHGIQWVKRENPKQFLAFNGEDASGIGKEFAPFIMLKIEGHQSTIACEMSERMGSYEMIIPGELLLSYHPMTFA